jgi:hypothetical protein
MYPQYWAWRLSGVAASEITSLGCHTDLWQPSRQQYSSLVDRMGWNRLFPPMRPAWTALNTLKPELAARTGLPENCRVLCGIHDSNASLLRHLTVTPAPAVLSTGTGHRRRPGAPLDALREQADMLANSDALGHAVPCIRFMGGREFAEPGRPAPRTVQPRRPASDDRSVHAGRALLCRRRRSVRRP